MKQQLLRTCTLPRNAVTPPPAPQSACLHVPGRAPGAGSSPTAGTKLTYCFLPLSPPPQVRVLVHTDVTKYLEFKGVDGSYVLSKARVEKVPATDYEALRSPLLGLFEKRRLRSFLLCVLRPAALAMAPLTDSSAVGARAGDMFIVHRLHCGLEKRLHALAFVCKELCWLLLPWWPFQHAFSGGASGRRASSLTETAAAPQLLMGRHARTLCKDPLRAELRGACPCRRSFVQEYNERDPRTYKGYNLQRMPMAALYKEYGLDPMTVDFIGHAIALHRWGAA